MTECLLVVLLAIMVVGCGGDQSAGSPCADGRCDPGLACERGVCRVLSPDADSGMDALARDSSTPLPADIGIDSAPSPDTLEDRDAPFAPIPPDPELPDTGPREISPAAGSCALPWTYSDLALDWERHRVWFTRPHEGLVSVLQLSDCTLEDIAVTGRPEHVFFEPLRDEVFVTAPTAELDAVVQSGWLVVLDATARAVRQEIPLPLHPWDVVSDGAGRAYISGAFWDFTTLVDVDVATSVVTPSRGLRLFERAELYLHPWRNRIYATTNRVTPTDIYRLSVGLGSHIEYDSPYHGEHETCGDLRLHPSGQSVYSACGGVFVASDARRHDLTWVADLESAWFDLAFTEDGTLGLLIRDGGDLVLFDAETLVVVRTIPIGVGPKRVLTARDYILIVDPVRLALQPLSTL